MLTLTKREADFAGVLYHSTTRIIVGFPADCGDTRFGDPDSDKDNTGFLGYLGGRGILCDEMR